MNHSQEHYEVQSLQREHIKYTSKVLYLFIIYEYIYIYKKKKQRDRKHAAALELKV